MIKSEYTANISKFPDTLLDVSDDVMQMSHFRLLISPCSALAFFCFG